MISDGAGGVNGLDISIAAGDLFSHQYRARSDFDFDGDVDGIDLGILYRAMLSGGSSAKRRRRLHSVAPAAAPGDQNTMPKLTGTTWIWSESMKPDLV